MTVVPAWCHTAFLHGLLAIKHGMLLQNQWPAGFLYGDVSPNSDEAKQPKAKHAALHLVAAACTKRALD